MESKWNKKVQDTQRTEPRSGSSASDKGRGLPGQGFVGKARKVTRKVRKDLCKRRIGKIEFSGAYFK